MIDANDAAALMLAWASGERSYTNEFLTVESDPSQRPQTLAAIAVADAAEVIKWAAVVLSRGVPL